MASKTKSSLFNKSSAASTAKAPKVSELLQALPSATTLRTESAAAPAAEQRRREFEERKATREARIEHTRALRNSYADYLIAQFVLLVAGAREKGWGWVTVEKAFPPSKEVDAESKQLVYVHEAQETHWAGLDEEGAPADPTEGGAPKVMLLQGPKPRKADASGRREPNPKDLPDGLTSVDVMRKVLAEKGYGVQVAYIKGMVNVIVIWDHAEWSKHQKALTKQREERSRAYQSDREATKGQISYAEYKAQMDAKKKPATAAAPDEEWVEAKPRRGKAAVAEPDDE